MGQVTETTIKMIEEHAARGEHAPLTVWELRQLAHAWRKANSLQLADVARTMPADVLSLPSGATSLGTYRNVDDGAMYTWGRCDDGYFRLDQFGWATWPTQEGFSRALLLAAAPQAPAAPSIPQWIDDPHDIEQGQMLNPAWVQAQAAPAAPEDPMDWPLPCDVTVGHGTIRKGCKLRTLVLRMQVLYNLAQETELAAPAAPAVDASDDTALLDAMQRHRIALVPEFEGPWDAEIYDDDAEARHIASGNTPREALRAALAAQAKEGGV